MKEIKINIETLRKNVLKLAEERNYKVDVDNPVLFQDKLHWLKIYDISPLKCDCADKLKVRKFAKIKTGEDLGVPLYGVWDDPAKINFDELPDKFVLKCNHGCGMNILVKDKKKLNMFSVYARLYKWMNKDYGNAVLEKHYSGIERRIFAEAWIEDGDKSEPADYKFFCFNGVPKFMKITNFRHSKKNKHLNFYDMDFNLIEGWGETKELPDPTQLDPKPLNWEKMKDYAAKLSEDFKFVRVDFYESNGKLYFNELNLRASSIAFALTYKGINLPSILINYLMGYDVDLSAVPNTFDTYICGSEAAMRNMYKEDIISFFKYKNLINSVDVRSLKFKDDNKPAEMFAIDDLLMPIRKVRRFFHL